MLGLTVTNSGEIKYGLSTILNFLVLLFAQVVFKLFESYPYTELPHGIDIFNALLYAIVLTLVFYGYNKMTEKNTNTTPDRG